MHYYYFWAIVIAIQLGFLLIFKLAFKKLNSYFLVSLMAANYYVMISYNEPERFLATLLAFLAISTLFIFGVVASVISIIEKKKKYNNFIYFCLTASVTVYILSNLIERYSDIIKY